MFTHSTPIPTDDELNLTHQQPSKLLHPGVTADKSYHLLMKEKFWESLPGDSYGIRYFSFDADAMWEPVAEESELSPTGIHRRRGKPFEVEVKGKALSLSDRMVVTDTYSGTPVAVIVRLHLRLQSTFKIYTLTPNIDSQVPSKNHKYDGRDLYEFAVCKDKWHTVRRTLRTAVGDEYVTDHVGKALDPEIRITRNGQVCSHMKLQNLGLVTGNQWDIKIAPGIDPVVMIAFRVIMDEMNEDFL